MVLSNLNNGNRTNMIISTLQNKISTRFNISPKSRATIKRKIIMNKRLPLRYLDLSKWTHNKSLFSARVQGLVKIVHPSVAFWAQIESQHLRKKSVPIWVLSPLEFSHMSIQLVAISFRNKRDRHSVSRIARATALKRTVLLAWESSFDFQPLRWAEILSVSSLKISFLEFGLQNGSPRCFALC